MSQGPGVCRRLRSLPPHDTPAQPMAATVSPIPLAHVLGATELATKATKATEVTACLRHCHYKTDAVALGGLGRRCCWNAGNIDEIMVVVVLKSDSLRRVVARCAPAWFVRTGDAP